MKRLFSAILCIILICLTGCAETPEEDIVVNKGDDTLVDIIENSEGAGIEIDESDLAYLDNKTDDLYYSFKSQNGDVTFNIGNDICIPNVDTVPVLTLAPHFFTSNEIERIAKAVFGDSEIYEYTEILTKAQLEKMILNEKHNKPTREYLLEQYNGDEEHVERTLNSYEERIRAMETDYLTAPAEDVRIVSDFQYHPDAYYTTETSDKYIVSGVDEKMMSVKATSEIDGIPVFMHVRSMNYDGARVSDLYLYPLDITDSKHESFYYQTTEFTEEEKLQAEKIVERFLADIDMGEWQISSIFYGGAMEQIDGRNTYGMTFHCVPLYSGIPLSDAMYFPSRTPGTDYTPTYRNSTFSITVSRGRIMGIIWESPTETVTTLNENVKLIKFDDILGHIYSKLEMMWTTGKIGAELNLPKYIELLDCVINVTKIEFCYMRTLIKDEPENFYMMPAWVVYGYNDIGGEKVGDTTVVYDEPEGTPHSGVILIINALDGSVTDSALGY